MAKWAKWSFMEEGNQVLEYFGRVIKNNKNRAVLECPGIGEIDVPKEPSGSSTVEELEENLNEDEARTANVQTAGNEDAKMQAPKRGSSNPQPKTQEGEKTYTVAGVSFYRGQYQMRLANNKNRERVLIKNGHEDVKMTELPQPMTKAEARDYLLSHMKLSETEFAAIEQS